MGRSAAGWMRAGLLLYCGAAVLVGGWAAGWPRSFYDDFPWPGHPWVALLGAYNEHLLRDFGGMNLAMAVVFGVAAASLDRRLAATVLVAYLVFAVPHLVFHLNHLEPFGTVDAVAQVAARWRGQCWPCSCSPSSPARRDCTKHSIGTGNMLNALRRRPRGGPPEDDEVGPRGNLRLLADPGSAALDLP
jgi:hypothetical protein